MSCFRRCTGTSQATRDPHRTADRKHESDQPHRHSKLPQCQPLFGSAVPPRRSRLGPQRGEQRYASAPASCRGLQLRARSSDQRKLSTFPSRATIATAASGAEKLRGHRRHSHGELPLPDTGSRDDRDGSRCTRRHECGSRCRRRRLPRKSPGGGRGRLVSGRRVGTLRHEQAAWSCASHPPIEFVRHDRRWGGPRVGG